MEVCMLGWVAGSGSKRLLPCGAGVKALSCLDLPPVLTGDDGRALEEIICGRYGEIVPMGVPGLWVSTFSPRGLGRT